MFGQLGQIGSGFGGIGARARDNGGSDPDPENPPDGFMDFSQATQSGLMLLLEDI